jgi:hypothetical protein
VSGYAAVVWVAVDAGWVVESTQHNPVGMFAL